MAHYPDMDDDEEEWEEVRPRRRGGPRFGPLITIAAAILVLFGAASRLGKPQPASGLFSLVDRSASTRLEEERLRTEEQRHRTILTLGAVPTTADSLRPRQPGIYSHSSPNSVQTPYRGDFDPYAPMPPRQEMYTTRPQIQMYAPMDNAPENYDRSGPFDPAPEAIPGVRPSGSTYTVAAGDNWVKIAKATGKRWQDIQKANPSSKNGLRVGMKLILP